MPMPVPPHEAQTAGCRQGCAWIFNLLAGILGFILTGILAYKTVTSLNTYPNATLQALIIAPIFTALLPLGLWLTGVEVVRAFIAGDTVLHRLRRQATQQPPTQPQMDHPVVWVVINETYYITIPVVYTDERGNLMGFTDTEGLTAYAQLLPYNPEPDQ